jgi:hypothetical protein
MGTSSSSKGPNSRSPLVPPDADADPQKPLPEPEGQRFRGFRTEFGRAAGGGGIPSLKSALGKYARDATHGVTVGPRRFGPAYSSGATLAQVLTELGSGGSGQNATGVDLSRLIGQPLDVAAQAIARALAPATADADQITAAIQEALAEALPDAETFDPASISDDQLVQILVEFFSLILFQEITNTAGDAWNKAPDAQHATQTEADLLELVRVVVDKHLSPRLARDLNNLSRDQITALERAAVDEIWREWESYQ